MGFIHLHVHSQYSFLDGASSLERLLEKAKSVGMPAIAITDHNRLTGAVRFYEKARSMGIKPIIGAEIDLEGGYHLNALAYGVLNAFYALLGEDTVVDPLGPSPRSERSIDPLIEDLRNLHHLN